MKKLRTLRRQSFLTQCELAQKAGVSHITINRIETGKQNPSFRTIRKLAKALGIKPREIKFN